MKFMKSGLGIAKVALIGVILATALSASAFALDVNVENQVKTISTGETAQFIVNLENTGTEEELVSLSTESDVTTMFSDDEVVLGAGQEKVVYLFALSADKGEGTYLIQLNANEETLNLALEIEEGQPALELYNGYGKVTAVQDSSQSIKMVAKNTGDEEIENVVVSGDFSEKLDAEYPEPFDLEAGEEKQVSVVLNVPLDFPKDEYDYEVTIASGSTKATQEVEIEVIGALPMKNRMSLKVLNAWEKMVDGNGEPIGYKVPVKVVNKGLVDLEEVQWQIEGLPEGWNVTGNEAFEIEGAETVEKTINFNAHGNFEDKTVELTLVKNDREITSEQIEFKGRKVGVTGTGLVLGGSGSIMLGLIVVAALALFVYMVREKNRHMERTGRTTDHGKLKKLVEETLEREKGKSEEEE